MSPAKHISTHDSGDRRRLQALAPTLLAAALLLRCGSSLAADPQPYRVDLSPTGNGAVDATLKSTSQLVVLRTNPVDPFGLIARARGDLSRLKTVLESFGYYQSSVAITINGLALDDPSLGDTLSALPKSETAHCQVNFTLGPLYHVGRVEIEGSVPAELRDTLGLASGAPAVANDVLAAGARLLTALENHGYAFAKVDPPIAYEDPQQQVLNLSFHVEAGPKVRIGEISFEGLKRVHERIVRRRLLLHTNQPYSALDVEKARKDLLTLGVFAAVSVRLAGGPDSEGRVPITFQMRERPRHAVSLSGGYSSDLGGSAGVSWTDRNLRGNAEQLVLSASVTNLSGTASTGIGYDTSAKYILPEFAHRDQSLQFAVGALKQQLQAYDQTAETSGVTLSRKLSSIWSASAGVTAEHETIVQEGNTRVYTLFALPIGVLYDSTDLPSPLSDPTHGMRGSLSVAPTLSRGRPNSTFYITQAGIARYFDLHRLLHTEPGRSVLAVRALAASAFGASTQDETVYEPTDCNGTIPCPCPKSQKSCVIPAVVRVPDLPPDQRFYAGGSGTVRGYRYQAVGPEFLDGNPIGGTAMDAVNVEFRQRFGTSFGAAVFVDAGNVSEKLTPFNGLLHGGRCSTSNPLQGAGAAAQSGTSCWAVGVGSGLRYYTPIGVLRLDFAVPTFRRANDDRFEIYIGLGQAF
jgi:translocation and assembly module TamA